MTTTTTTPRPLPFPVGARVRLKPERRKSWGRAPKGRRNFHTATIYATLEGFAPGAWQTDRDLHGCRYWNADDLEAVT